MKRLILLRHAKSDWSHTALSDHDRPLNQRGRKAAPAMGAWLAAEGFAPDLAYVSSAARAQETWRLSGLAAPMETVPRLYGSSPEIILDVARRADEAAETIVIVCHQPGVQAAACMMLRDGVVEAYPTGKAVVLGFDAEHWFGVGFGEAALIAEMAPRELPGRA